MKHTIVLCLLLILSSQLMRANEKHAIVPGTRGNSLTLEVANRMGHHLEALTAIVVSKPAWITITSQISVAPMLMPDSTAEITLQFNIAPELEAGKEDSITVQLLAGDRVVAYRTISFIVAVPQKYALSQNYPNPFNPTTHIRYELPEESRVQLIVYDILGREVIRLVDEQKAAGYLEVQWDARTSAGTTASSGVYFCRLDARPLNGGSAFSQVKKLMLLR
jgi:hypothetical protein